ncbi:MAG TPA: hypothetical protein VF016_03970 [Nitrososphaera sp.]
MREDPFIWGEAKWFLIFGLVMMIFVIVFIIFAVLPDLPRLVR